MAGWDDGVTWFCGVTAGWLASMVCEEIVEIVDTGFAAYDHSLLLDDGVPSFVYGRSHSFHGGRNDRKGTTGRKRICKDFDTLHRVRYL